MADQLPADPPFVPGSRQVSAGALNAVTQQAKLTAMATFDGEVETIGGVEHHFDTPPNTGLWAKLTAEGAGGTAGQYAWTEQQLDGYTFSDLDQGRSGTTTDNYAKEPNGRKGIGTGTIVRLVPGSPTEAGGVVSDNWLIEAERDASHSQSGVVNLSDQYLGAGVKKVDRLELLEFGGGDTDLLTGPTLAGDIIQDSTTTYQMAAAVAPGSTDYGGLMCGKFAVAKPTDRRYHLLMNADDHGAQIGYVDASGAYSLAILMGYTPAGGAVISPLVSSNVGFQVISLPGGTLHTGQTVVTVGGTFTGGILTSTAIGTAKLPASAISGNWADFALFGTLAGSNIGGTVAAANVGGVKAGSGTMTFGTALI